MTDDTDWMVRFKALQGDITKQKVDAIVNAAKESLLGGGGVDGAIHRAAGSALFDECRELGGCPTGEARITNGYALPAKYVIHTVGPVWQGGGQGEADLLASCYRNSLAIVEEYELTSVAFPAISCGVYRYPIEEATQIALREFKAFLQANEQVDRLYAVCFTEDMYEAYREGLQAMLPE